MNYDAQQFATTFETERGAEIWEFLTAPDTLIRLETATYLRRPAVEPLSPFLLERFGDDIRKDRTKQMIGHMVRQVLENRGYRISQQNVKIAAAGNMFVRGTRYAPA